MNIARDNNLIDEYLNYVKDTDECPMYVHRWCITTAFSAYLSRNVWIKFGTNRIYPNLYVKIIGPAGCRKSTGIRKVKKILQKEFGYDKFANEQTSKEKFIEDLALHRFGAGADRAFLSTDEALTYLDELEEISEVFIVADEFNDFIGTHNVPFCSMLGNLWDYDGEYKPSFKSSGNIKINNPTITILGGNTHDAMIDAFPSHLIGQGFTSRVLFIAAEGTIKRIAWPKAISNGIDKSFKDIVDRIRINVRGELIIPDMQKEAITNIYENWQPLEDARLAHYSSRRHMQLLKLIMNTTTSRGSMTVSTEDIIYANTLLHYAEKRMPIALGEFGRSKNSAANMKITALLSNPPGRELSVSELWANGLNNEVEDFGKLSTILDSLRMAKKIVANPVTGKWKLYNNNKHSYDPIFTNFSLLKETLK